jgi:hypothetical protein
MIWLCVKLPSSEVPSGRFAAMRGLFENAFSMAGGPATAAMMENSPNYGEHAFYFSPAAAAFILPFLTEHGYSATACDAPPLEGTALLVGQADALERLLSSASKSEE